MPNISATDAARRFSDLLDAVEHDGADFVVTRHGTPVARIEPVRVANGRQVRELLRQHDADEAWRDDLDAVRGLLDLDLPA